MRLGLWHSKTRACIKLNYYITLSIRAAFLQILSASRNKPSLLPTSEPSGLCSPFPLVFALKSSAPYKVLHNTLHDKLSLFSVQLS